MKKLLLLLTTVFIYCSNSLSQNSENQDSYLSYRSEKMFFIKESSDQKIIEYPLLSSITLIDLITKVEKKLTPDEFIISYQKGEINNLSINILRDRFIELSYRIGNTGFVLIGRSEEQIATEFSQLIK